MQILATVAIEQVTFSLVSATWLACGKAQWEFRFGLANTLLAIVAFIVGTKWGLVGVAVGNLATNALLLPIKVTLTLRVLELRLSALLEALRPAAIAGAAQLLVAFAILSAGGPNRLSLTVAAVAAGACAYAAVLLTVFRTETRSLLSEVRHTMSVRGKPATAA